MNKPLLNKGLIVGAFLMIAPTTSYAIETSTGNPILDGIRWLISLNNINNKIQNTDWPKAIEKGTINTIETKTREYQYQKNLEKLGK